MYHIEVSYSDGDIVNDSRWMRLSEMELGSFLNMLSKKYNKLYSVECSDHIVFGFGKETKKVVVKVEH
jgi:hypothetical protein